MRPEAWPGDRASTPSVFFSVDIPEHLPSQRGVPRAGSAGDRGLDAGVCWRHEQVRGRLPRRRRGPRGPHLRLEKRARHVRSPWLCLLSIRGALGATCGFLCRGWRWAPPPRTPRGWTRHLGAADSSAGMDLKISQRLSRVERRQGPCGCRCQVEVEFLAWDLGVWSCFRGEGGRARVLNVPSEPLFGLGRPARGRGPCVCVF